jgi:flagella basal body P-ring formation protein FlgA
MMQLNDLIGFESNKAIKAGKIIYSHNVIAPTIVKKGQSIQLYKRSGNLELTIDCVTGSDSNIGEVIMINCVNLRKKYLGEVISESKAIWRKSL